jgi:phosphatidylinositol alpha-1,6-mannosyltransferase
MKILLTLDFPPERGGIQTYLSDIVKHEYRECDIVLAGCIPAHADADDPPGASVERISGTLSALNKKCALIGMYRRYRTLCKRADSPDVACGNIYAALVAWLHRLLHGQPYAVYTYAAELLALKRSILKRRLFISVLSRASKVYVLTAYGKSLLRDLGVATPAVTASPRIDLRDAPRYREDLAGRRHRILCVGRLVLHKGHDTLVRAVARLPAEVPWRVTLAGNGPRRSALVRCIHANGADERIQIETDCDNASLAQCYEQAGMFVFPSLELPNATEGFGIALLEAMAAGLPIVASRCGGIPEALGYGSRGLLARPGDPESFARAIVELYTNHELCETLRTTALRDLHKHYVWRA